MLRFTRVAERRFPEQFKRRVLDVYDRVVPELHDRDIVVGLTTWAAGTANYSGTKISLSRGASNQTITHEFMHVLFSHGEKGTDLETAARLPVDMWDDYFSYLGIPRLTDEGDILKLKELAGRALSDQGRGYIKRFQREWREYLAQKRRGALSSLWPPANFQ
jgi:hypothetical protein